jgi:hypothetical protein
MSVALRGRKPVENPPPFTLTVSRISHGQRVFCLSGRKVRLFTMKDKLRPALSAIAVAIAGYASYPLITLIFSNGLLWNYTQSQLQCEQLDVEKAVKKMAYVEGELIFHLRY